MTITIRVNVTDTVKKLTDLERTQLPFALSLAINRTGEDFQKAERAHFATVFTERRKDFIEKQGVKRLSPAASKKNPTVTFGVDPKADFLNKFEQGGDRPKRGSSIMIPEDVKRNKKDIITKANRPRALIANKTGTGAGSVFLLKTQRGKLAPGLYQRTGRGGRGGLKMLFARTTHAKIPPTLKFEATFIKTVKDRWATNFTNALAEAVRTAK